MLPLESLWNIAEQGLLSVLCIALFVIVGLWFNKFMQH